MPVAVAAEALGVAVDPGERAAHLLVHRKQIAAGLIDVDEVDDDAMRAGADQQLGLQRVVGRDVPPPRAAVNEHVDRRAFDAAVEDVEALVLARPVGDALRHGRGWRGPARSPPSAARRSARGSAPRFPGRRPRPAPAGPCRGRPAGLSRGTAEPGCTFMAGRLTQPAGPGHIARRRARAAKAISAGRRDCRTSGRARASPPPDPWPAGPRSRSARASWRSGSGAAPAPGPSD